MVLAMEADSPSAYVSKMTKSIRKGKIFIDYLRNGRGATAVAAYSTRARPGATVSAPVAWDELGAKTPPDKFTMSQHRQAARRLKKDPWADIGEGEAGAAEPDEGEVGAAKLNPAPCDAGSGDDAL